MFLQFEFLEAIYVNIFLQELEEDYRRFLDYTDGMFHSDYMMQLRLKARSKIEPPEVFNNYKGRPEVILNFRDLNPCDT